MAQPGLNAAQMLPLLPRFLLPRLSWQTVKASPAHLPSIRALSTSSSSLLIHRKAANSISNRNLTRPDSNGTTRPKSSILQNPAYSRAFHATTPRGRDHHFDTLKFVQRLQEEGFTEPQAVAMMKVLSDVIEERYVQK